MNLSSLLLYLLIAKSLPQAIYSMPSNFLQSDAVKNITCYNNSYIIQYDDVKDVFINFTIDKYTSRLNQILRNRASNELISASNNNTSCGMSISGKKIVDNIKINYGIFNQGDCKKNLVDAFCPASFNCNSDIVCCNNSDLSSLPCNDNYMVSHINLTVPIAKNNHIKNICYVDDNNYCFQVRKITNPTAEYPTTNLNTNSAQTTNSTVISTTNSSKKVLNSWYIYLIVFLKYLG